MDEIRVQRIGAGDVLPLRRKVLRQGMPPETALFPGDDEPQTFHLGAMRGEEIVGIATFLVRPYPLDTAASRGWQLRGMAVDPKLQSHGVGSKILETAIELLRPELHPIGGDRATLWCKARKKAVEFYRRNGWIIEGEEFEIANFGWHHFMKWSPQSGGERDSKS